MVLLEVEGELVAGEVAGGEGAAHVEGFGAAGGGEGLGTLGDRGVEVQGVGQVELGLHEGGALQGDLVVVEGDVASLGRGLGVGCGLGGHEPGLGDLDEPVQGGWAEAVRERRDLGVDERRCRHRQAQGLLGDAAGPPHRHLTAGDAGVEPRQPVAQFQAVGDQHPAGVGGDPECGGQLGQAELRHQRRSGSGQRELALPADARGARPGRCGVDRLRGMGLGPERGRGQYVDLRGVRRRPPRPDEPQHVTGSLQLTQPGGGSAGGCGGRRHGTSQPATTDTFERVSEHVDNFSTLP